MSANRYRTAHGARCRCGAELILRDESVLVCPECGGEPDESQDLRVGQRIEVGGIKGACKLVVLPDGTDPEGDLRAVVRDELGGLHAVKRQLCRRKRS